MRGMFWWVWWQIYDAVVTSLALEYMGQPPLEFYCRFFYPWPILQEPSYERACMTWLDYWWWRTSSDRRLRRWQLWRCVDNDFLCMTRSSYIGGNIHVVFGCSTLQESAVWLKKLAYPNTTYNLGEETNTYTHVWLNLLHLSPVYTEETISMSNQNVT